MPDFRKLGCEFSLLSHLIIIGFRSSARGKEERVGGASIGLANERLSN